MKVKLATMAFVGLTVFSMSACSTAPMKTAEVAKEPAKSEPAKPALSDAAQQALNKATADIKTAKAKFALWTTADKAYKDALEAAKTGDSNAVIKQAQFVSDQVARGIAQLDYPSTEMK